MNSFVVHMKERVDRSKYINALATRLPFLEIVPGQAPQWEHADGRTVRGCSLAHLDTVRDHLGNEPILVLEDDAVVHEPGFEQWLSLSAYIPKDAGIIMLGGDTERLGPPDAHGFREILPPVFGSHAVLYLPQLLRQRWLMHAYSVLAHRRVDNNLCYESVMMLALEQSGLKMYRPPVMAFATADSFSDREGQLMKGRTVNLDLRTPAAPVGFVVTAFKEDAALVDTALTSIRRVYPQAPIALISDGGDDYAPVAVKHSARYLLGKQLKTPANGHLWWKRFAAEARLQNAHTVFKFDPDALLHRAFAAPFPTSGVFGTIAHFETDDAHVQGGIQGFAPDALTALETTPMRWDAMRDYFSTDYSLKRILESSGLPRVAYPEISSFWEASVHPPSAAATHPHKPTAQ